MDARRQVSDPRPDVWPKRCGCGCEISPEEWRGLPGKKFQPTIDGPKLEMRECLWCGSTLAIEIQEIP
jgi:hypothetical protein